MKFLSKNVYKLNELLSVGGILRREVLDKLLANLYIVMIIFFFFCTQAAAVASFLSVKSMVEH